MNTNQIARYLMALIGGISGILVSLIMTLFIMLPTFTMVGTRGGLYTQIGFGLFILLSLPLGYLLARYGFHNSENEATQRVFFVLALIEGMIIYTLVKSYLA
jgi:hypothetical protein